VAEIILHHYAGSLFSEKIRLLLGYLGLPWRSVEIESIMPRPELMPLSGGYRKTPIMQEGADVWCDTRVIAERLVEVARRPELCRGFVTNRVAEWADSHLFRVVVAVTFQPRAVMATMSTLSATQIAAFQKDRAELSKGAPIVSIAPAAAEAHLAGYLAELDASLDAPFLQGTAPTIADFSVYHCLWLVANNTVMAPLLDGHARVKVWRARMAAFGHGTVLPMSRAEALDVGRRATPAAVLADGSGLPAGIALGDDVNVTPTDYGLFPVRGRLLRCSHRDAAIARKDPDAGDIVVHFPRIGFVVEKA
jgi:glutathione S-transferase